MSKCYVTNPYKGLWMNSKEPLYFVVKFDGEKMEVIFSTPNEQDAKQYAAVVNINCFFAERHPNLNETYYADRESA